MDPKIGLVYLNRRAEGSLPVQRFIRSYEAFAPGVTHEFITLYKGFADSELSSAKDLFKKIEHRHLTLSDEMTDIDSYLVATESFSDIDIFCFLNTFSEIASENWLLSLFSAISRPGVGIAGATASYESIVNSNRLISKVIWMCSNGFLKYDPNIHLQYQDIIGKHAKPWLRKHFFPRIFSALRWQKSDYSYTSMYDAEFEDFWKILTSGDNVYAFLSNEPSFPNPHIRSNGFMVKREYLLPFLGKTKKMNKNESYLFESGASSLTNQILNRGLRAVVVNNLGDLFDIEAWPQSQTFRLGQQHGLLIRDNQTRNFDRLNSAEREVLAYMTWGNSLENSTGRAFTFGLPFDVS